MTESSFFAGVDADAVNRVAVGFAKILLAAVDLVRGEDPDDAFSNDVMWAGMLRMNLGNVAAAIVHDHTDEEHDEELLEKAIAFLRAEVTQLRSEL